MREIANIHRRERGERRENAKSGYHSTELERLGFIYRQLMLFLCVLCVLCGEFSAAFAQENKVDAKMAAQPRASSEPLTAWEWSADVKMPAAKGSSNWVDFLLTPPVMDKARADLGDIRLVDANERV